MSPALFDSWIPAALGVIGVIVTAWAGVWVQGRKGRVDFGVAAMEAINAANAEFQGRLMNRIREIESQLGLLEKEHAACEEGRDQDRARIRQLERQVEKIERNGGAVAW